MILINLFAGQEYKGRHTEGFKFLDCKSWSCEGFLANMTILPTNGYRVLSICL